VHRKEFASSKLSVSATLEGADNGGVSSGDVLLIQGSADQGLKDHGADVPAFEPLM
jgi:hypothetical protein